MRLSAYHFSAHEIVGAFIGDFAGFISSNDGLDIWMHPFNKLVVLGFWIKTLFESLQPFRGIPDAGQRSYGKEVFHSLSIHFK